MTDPNLTEQAERRKGWIARCAAQYLKRSPDLHPADAAQFAETNYDENEFHADYENDPEGAADEEMENWTDD